LPSRDAAEALREGRAERPAAELKTVLSGLLPRRLAERLCEVWLPNKPMRQYRDAELNGIGAQLSDWPMVASGTEGYRTAEVTLGGVDTDEVSSSTMMSRRQPGLYFVGEVLDVTGHLGGYNFQWAWASGHAAGLAV
jgi:predicted Rossmann fold flavoprotein